MRFSLFATLGLLAFAQAGFFKGIDDTWSFDLDIVENTKWMGNLRDDVAFVEPINSWNSQFHDAQYQTSLKDVLTTLFDFLDDYPSEAVILRIQKGGVFDDSTAFLSSLEQYLVPGSELGKRAAQHVYSRSADDTTIPTLGEVRGKVLILQDFQASPPSLYGIPWSSRTVSSYTQIFTPSSLLLPLKWAGIKSHISKSRSQDNDKLRITHTTAGAGVQPINIAARDGYRFGMNRHLGRYLLFKRGSCFGIIVMDFPGYVVVQYILRLNNQYQKPELT
ncbi:1-phosphatidylinositol phosphodiesterase [Ceratocystis lukuohia]|uniref:1-phosphatidylinositol phosphodiesterase n=1 Tax=Ceratocystis lukuohia TaxID=2019550 RepID=A0ABR4MA42_9PEZI